ncbi:MAG: VOC family protein [Candidatus Methanomethylophilaceae archaeon]|jgi:catechol 2,3-dioxygenase-like lactoylglutathione lyase family enzyme|nr:VOC family protein [Candidatus Methanomethylophilaceae archaeon]
MGLAGRLLGSGLLSSSVDAEYMPLGDPHGANFEYTVEGLPESVHVCTVPVRDVSRALGFYKDILHMEVLSEDDREAYLIRGDCRIILKKSDSSGVDTGLYFGVDSPYNTRRRLIDEGVVFAQEPKRGPFGTFCSIRDDDGNVIHLIERNADFKKE